MKLAKLISMVVGVIAVAVASLSHAELYRVTSIAPGINWLMVKNLGPYKKMENAPELEKNLGMIFNYEIGPYHYITRADSGIEKLEDIAGRKIFAGPPGGAAKRVCLGNIKKTTGLEGGKDFEAVDFGFDAAIQAFQDDKIDVIVLSTNFPSSAVSQFALTKKIRILDVDTDKLSSGWPSWMSATVVEIPPDAYGDNQVNTSLDEGCDIAG